MLNILTVEEVYTGVEALDTPLFRIELLISIIGNDFLLAITLRLFFKLKGSILYFLLSQPFWIVGIVNPDYEVMMTLVFIGNCFFLYIPIAYAYLAVKSEGKVRRKAITVVILFCLYLLGSLMGTGLVNSFFKALLGSQGVIFVYVNYIYLVAGLLLFYAFK